MGEPAWSSSKRCPDTMRVSGPELHPIGRLGFLEHGSLQSRLGALVAGGICAHVLGSLPLTQPKKEVRGSKAPRHCADRNHADVVQHDGEDLAHLPHHQRHLLPSVRYFSEENSAMQRQQYNEETLPQLSWCILGHMLLLQWALLSHSPANKTCSVNTYLWELFTTFVKKMAQSCTRMVFFAWEGDRSQLQTTYGYQCRCTDAGSHILKSVGMSAATLLFIPGLCFTHRTIMFNVK